jgi:phospholipid/cholesterol/gamma-HCH transport system permease protein
MLEKVSFDTSGLTNWDSGLIAFLVQTSEACRARGINQDRKGLPEGLGRLLELAEAVPEKKGTRSKVVKDPFFQRVGNMTLGSKLGRQREHHTSNRLEERTMRSVFGVIGRGNTWRR